MAVLLPMIYERLTFLQIEQTEQNMLLQKVILKIFYAFTQVRVTLVSFVIKGSLVYHFIYSSALLTTRLGLTALLPLYCTIHV